MRIVYRKNTMRHDQSQSFQQFDLYVVNFPINPVKLTNILRNTKLFEYVSRLVGYEELDDALPSVSLLV